MRLMAVVLIATATMFGSGARAQQAVWVQIEAQPSLREATERARAYSLAFGDVSGFAMTTGWYAIALGPYPAETAAARLQDLRNGRLIPQDSYINDGRNFRQRFWPVGTDIGADIRTDIGTDIGAPLAPRAEAQEPARTAAVEPELMQAQPYGTLTGAADPETPAEARRSEAGLDSEARAMLQTALRWKGFYEGAIDGAFGAGTREAMANWQAAGGYAATGILTTAQRAELLAAYRADLATLGLTELRDDPGGIAMQIPGAMVAFAGYEPPFVRFSEKDASGVEMLLISDTGTPKRLAALYKVLQSLEIIPHEGPRNLSADGFTISRRGADRRAHAEAHLADGFIKGFVLSWPAEKDARIARVLPVMRSSFTAYGDHALPPTAGSVSDQRPDLLAGLQIRRPERIRSGFFISPTGIVVTTAEAVAECRRITITGNSDMTVTFSDAALGLAALRPTRPLSPVGYARLRITPPRLNSEIAVAGFAYGDALTMPVLTYGGLADLRGLRGEEGLNRLSVTIEPGDTGGPVLDATGAVIGLLQARPDMRQQVLPDDVNFALGAGALASALAAHDIRVSQTRDTAAPLPPEDLTRHAADITVMVSCWEKG
jgi:S1-C subfamily serine protease/peptidoglycan hydrolase-like protein with peptidoglycan-binding domain